MKRYFLSQNMLEFLSQMIISTISMKLETLNNICSNFNISDYGLLLKQGLVGVKKEFDLLIQITPKVSHYS